VIVLLKLKPSLWASKWNARLKMKVVHKDPLKEVKDTITFAIVFTLTVMGET